MCQDGSAQGGSGEERLTEDLLERLLAASRPEDFLDAEGVAARAGHHCAQPVHRHFGVYASNRASSGIYNSVEDAQALIEALGKVRPFFGVE